jgi:shikimate kinase
VSKMTETKDNSKNFPKEKFQKPIPKKSKPFQNPFGNSAKNQSFQQAQSPSGSPSSSGSASAQQQRQFRNIVVYGMPGSGKSTFAKSYAALTKRQHLDLDKYIEHMAGKTLPEIFASAAETNPGRVSGEDYFRSLEKKALDKLLRRNNTVISMGGGTIQNSENFNLVQQLGLLVSLECSNQTLAKRIFETKESRPLFSKCQSPKEIEKKLEELFSIRGTFLEKSDVNLNSEFGGIDTLKMELKWHEREYFRKEWVRDMLTCVGKEYLTDTNPFERLRRRPPQGSTSSNPQSTQRNDVEADSAVKISSEPLPT